MAHIELISGPPFSADLWEAAANRFRHHGHTPNAHPLFESAAPQVGLEALAQALVAPAGPGERVLMAHGLAVPIALRAAHQGWSHLVLSNGPLRPAGKALQVLGRMGRIPGALRPGLLQAYLSSSAGLRRAATNPYVMDRDTVVALSDPLFRENSARAGVVRYLADLASAGEAPPPSLPTLLVWGDEDRLHPIGIADSVANAWPQASLRRIPGGHFVHPVERPWAVADCVSEWLSEG